MVEVIGTNFAEMVSAYDPFQSISLNRREYIMAYRMGRGLPPYLGQSCGPTYDADVIAQLLDHRYLL